MTQSYTATVKYQEGKFVSGGNKPPELSFTPFCYARFKKHQSLARSAGLDIIWREVMPPFLPKHASFPDGKGGVGG